MNKIIAAFNGLRFSESTMEYAIYLAKQYNTHLTGVFLHESTTAGFAIYTSIVKQSASGSSIFDEIEKSDKIAINNAVEIFESACSDAGLNYTIHRNRRNATRELLNETAFADLLVIDAMETFSYLEEDVPGWFIKNILHESQCAVFVVPKQFYPIEQTMLLYDGTPSSIFAIKMFNYILPGLGNLKTRVLYANNENYTHHVPHEKLMKEWMQNHYPNVTYKILNGHEKEIVALAAREGSGTLLVAGSYHRSNFSMLLHHSLADLLLSELKAPVFVAHS